MNDKIKFAIVGFGNIGPRHATHIVTNEEAELISVCDVDKSRFDDLYIEKGVVFTDDFQQILNNASIDVVSVCVPNYLHKEFTVRSLSAGKHVLCEKPMAMNTIECGEMIEASDSNDKLLFIVKQNRYNPPVKAVKEIIENGTLGKVYQVNINCFWNRNSQYFKTSTWKGSKLKDGGCLFTPFSHFVDILYYFFGDIDHIEGMVSNYAHEDLAEFEDSGVFNLTTASGIMVSFNFSTCAHEKNMEGSFTIIGENGTVKIGGQYLNTIDYQNIEGFEIKDMEESKPGNDYGFYKGSMSNHGKVIQNVVDTIKGRDNISTVGDEGLKVVEIIERMYASAKQIKPR